MVRSLRFFIVLMAVLMLSVCFALILLPVMLGTVSNVTAPIGRASPHSTQSQEAQPGTTTQETIPLQTAQSSDQNGPCDWVINIFGEHHIDICFPLRLIVQAGAGTIRGIYHTMARQIDFLWSTPLAPFQDNKQGLLTIWLISWGIVLTCVTAVISWAALRYAVGAVLSWLSYANLIELIPRLLFALLAAFYSRQFFLMLLQINNALANLFNTNALNIVLDQNTAGILNNLMQILYGVLAFLLILEGAARIAVIYLLFAFAPILFFLASLRETQRWAKIAATAAILFIFLQTMQAGALDVGGLVLTSVLHSKPGDLTFLNLLVSVAIMYVTLTLFFGVARTALGRGGDALAYAPFAAALGVGRSWRGAARSIGTATEVTRSHLRTVPHPLAFRNPRAITLGTKRGLPPGLPPPSGAGPGEPPPTPPSGGLSPTPGPGGSGSGGPLPPAISSGGGTSPLATGGSLATPAPSTGEATNTASGPSKQAVQGTWQKTPLTRPAGKVLSPSPASQMSGYYANKPPHKQIGRPAMPEKALPALYTSDEKHTPRYRVMER